MTIFVNGEAVRLDTPATLGVILDARVADRRGVAVAVDGAVVPRSDWDTTQLHDGVRVEIVGAVQGG